MMKKIAETVGHEISYTRLYHSVSAVGVKLSKDTIITYVDYAKSAYLIFSVQNYAYRFSDRESTPKFYFTDNGLLNLFLFDKDPARLENLVATHLKRNCRQPFYYLHSTDAGVDVDFYLPESGSAIQVAYSIKDDAARRREVDNLTTLAAQGWNIHRFLIVTHEEEAVIETGGITIEVQPIYRFLLDFGDRTSV